MKNQRRGPDAWQQKISWKPNSYVVKKIKGDHTVSHFDTTRCPGEKMLQGPDDKCGMSLIVKTIEYAKINVTF